jgi:hypothetical protein
MHIVCLTHQKFDKTQTSHFPAGWLPGMVEKSNEIRQYIHVVISQKIIFTLST